MAFSMNTSVGMLPPQAHLKDSSQRPEHLLCYLLCRVVSLTASTEIFFKTSLMSL